MQNSAEQIADEILVLDAQDGRGEALEHLIARWQKRLWWHAFQLTGRTEAAWDITQESWLAIVRGLGRLNDPARFGSWAYRIVSHKAYDWRHRNGRECPSEFEAEDLPATVAEGMVAERPNPETMGDVRDILSRLPARSQVVLNLYYLEGFGLAEIAEVLGTPAGTVKSRLHAARIEFRKIWESLDGFTPASIPASGKE